MTTETTSTAPATTVLGTTSPAAPAATPPAAPPKGETSEKQDSGATGATETKPDPEQGKTGDKAADDSAKANPPAAADVEIVLPKGVKADDALLAEFKPLAKAIGLDSAKAQQVADLYLKRQVALEQAAAKQREDQIASWRKTVEADKDVGGDHLPASQQAIAAVMTKFGSDELRAVLNESGLGNHPALVKFVVSLGKAMADDTVEGSVGQRAPTAPMSQEQFLRDVMYPNSNK